jgi:hypothetical protein
LQIVHWLILINASIDSNTMIMTSLKDEVEAENKFLFISFVADLVPEDILIQKGISRDQLISYLLGNAMRITFWESTQMPFVGTLQIVTLNPSFNLQLPKVAILPLLRNPFLFGSLIDSFVEHHRTATGALFELMFSQEEELDEIGEEGIYLFTSVAISQTPSRIAIKRARLGEGSEFPYVRNL